MVQNCYLRPHPSRFWRDTFPSRGRLCATPVLRMKFERAGRASPGDIQEFDSVYTLRPLRWHLPPTRREPLFRRGTLFCIFLDFSMKLSQNCLEERESPWYNKSKNLILRISYWIFGKSVESLRRKAKGPVKWQPVATFWSIVWRGSAFFIIMDFMMTPGSVWMLN